MHFLIVKPLYIALLLFLSGCTISLSNTCTHGNAQNVGDATDKTDATTSADIKLPAVG